MLSTMMAEVGSDKNPSRPPDRHFHAVSFSQQSTKTLWTAPDMSHHVLFHAFFKVVYCTFAPSPPELMEELCHSAQSLETRHCLATAICQEGSYLGTLH